MTMDKNRLWLIGLVAVMVAVVAMGWLLGIQPQLSAASAADAQRATVQAQNAQNEAVLAKLKKDYSSIDELKKQLVSLRQSVPASADMSAFVTELDTLAGVHQVTVKSISVSDAMPYTAPAAPVAAPSASASPSATPTPAPTAAAPAAPVAPTAPPAVTNPKITAANFIAVPIQLSISGPYSNVLDFVNGLQMGPRLFLVTTFSTTSSSDTTAAAGSVDSSVGGFVYVVLDANAAAEKAANPTPTPKPKATPTPKSTTTPTPTSTPTPTTTPGG
jgi:Tfp pilus assembly protein PilO